MTTARFSARLVLLTALSLLAFAANSLLCRAALKGTGTDPGSFTSIRLVSGAAVLWLLVRARGAGAGRGLAGSWWSALALSVYAVAFSYAYAGLPAAPGALILFGCVQGTMIGYGLWSGERLRPGQWGGLLLALGGLVALLLPGLSAPPPGRAALMAIAGIAWGAYSLRGRGAADPTGATAGNFVRSVPFAVALSAALFLRASVDRAGFWEAVVSGVVTSGLGYVVWYTALPRLSAVTASTVQLSVPVIAATGGVLCLGESVTWRLAGASVAILGGIGWFILAGPGKPKSRGG